MVKTKHPLVPVGADGKCPPGNYLPPRDGKCYYWDKTGCGDSEVKLNPEKTDVTKGETIKIGFTYYPDLDLVNAPDAWFDGDSGWTKCNWTVVGQAVPGNPPSVDFKMDTPGTYEVSLRLETKMKACRFLEPVAVIITVHEGDPPPPPPPPPPIECGENYIKNASGECVCDVGYILKDGKCMRDTDGDGTHDDDDDDIDGDGIDNDEDDDIDGDGIKNEDDENPYINDLMYAKALQSQYMGDVFYKEPTATMMGDEGTVTSQLPSTPLLVMGGLLVAFYLMPKQNK